jgi:homoserine kinase
MPATAELVGQLRAAGVAAAVSGAGPSVLALSPVPSGFDTGKSWVAHSLAIDSAGAALMRGNILD